MGAFFEKLKADLDLGRKKKVFQWAGHEYELWMTEPTMGDRYRARGKFKKTGDTEKDIHEMCLQLLFALAENETGVKLFDEFDIIEMRDIIPYEILQDLFITTITMSEGEEAVQSDMKSDPKKLKAGQPAKA